MGHLITSSFFESMHRVLLPGGQIVILSDNWYYLVSLARSVAGLNEKHGKYFETMLNVGIDSGSTGTREFEDVDGVRIYMGTPGRECGYVVATESSFDSKWADDKRTERFFLALVKPDS